MSRMPALSRLLLPFFAIMMLLLPMACAQDETAPATDDMAETDSVAETPDAASVAADLPPRVNEARPSPNASVAQTIGTTEVTITYGRPGVKGRQVFGGLEQYGNVWRAGANEATVIHFTDDVTIEGQPLAAGAYAFFAIPGETEWTLIFNEQAEQWGAFDHDPAQDALRVTVTPESGPQQEWLSYSFDDLTDTSATVVLAWDTVRVPFTIAVP